MFSLNLNGIFVFFKGIHAVKIEFFVYINPLDAKPFSLISAKGFLVKFVYREVMTLLCKTSQCMT